MLHCYHAGEGMQGCEVAGHFVSIVRKQTGEGWCPSQFLESFLSNPLDGTTSTPGGLLSSGKPLQNSRIFFEGTFILDVVVR